MAQTWSLHAASDAIPPRLRSTEIADRRPDGSCVVYDSLSTSGKLDVVEIRFSMIFPFFESVGGSRPSVLNLETYVRGEPQE